MAEHGRADFVKRPRRKEELLRPHRLEDEWEYEVVKTVWLRKIDYENFAADMLADRSFLEENAELCIGDGGRIRCLEIRCRGSSERILVRPDRAWVDMAALTSDPQDR